jgi:hypothetical protein
MGKLENGAFGAITGKVAKLVSYKLRGQNVVRKNRTVKIKATATQLPVRERMRIVNDFLRPIKDFINLGFMFKAEGTVWNQYNVATSYTLLHAMVGEYPNISIDYSKVMVSAGKLKSATAPTVEKVEGALLIKWTYDAVADFSFRNDRAMILLSFPSGDEPIYFLSGSLRSEGMQSIALDPETITRRCDIYVSFFAEKRKSVSDSKHIYII